MLLGPRARTQLKNLLAKTCQLNCSFDFCQSCGGHWNLREEEISCYFVLMIVMAGFWYEQPFLASLLAKWLPVILNLNKFSLPKPCGKRSKYVLILKNLNVSLAFFLI